MGPLDFLIRLFGDAISEDHNLVIWESTRKKSVWFSDAFSAAVKAEEINKSADTYFGCLLQDRSAMKGNSRGSAETARVLGGLWLDIDLALPTHTKQGLPTSEGEVRAAIERLPLPPSLVLFTGGGYHAWWMLREPYTIDTDTERSAIVAPTVDGWQRFCAEQFGFTIDQTGDLARVMRLPGLLNHKYNTVVSPARWSNPAKSPSYSLSDFEAWRLPPRKQYEIADTQFIVDISAGPPTEKFGLLMDLESKFRASWTRRRRMESQSEYDYSLASYAIQYGWSDQEIVDLLIAHRRATNPTDKKIERAEYFARTIGKLRSERKGDQQVAAAVERIEEAAKAPETQASRSQAINDLSQALGFAVDRVIKYVSDPPIYRLELPEGAITLGGVETILTFARFKAKIAAATNRVLPRAMSRRWEAIAGAILSCSEVRDLGEASEPGNGVGAWLREYLSSLPELGDDRHEAAASQSAWLEDEHAWFWSSRLQAWLVVRGIRMSYTELAVKLRNSGAHPRVVGIKRDGRQTTVRVWGIPIERVELAPRRRARS